MENIEFSLDNFGKTYLCLETSGFIAVAVNKSNIITDINNKGCEIIGSSKEDIVNHVFFDVFNPAEHSIDPAQRIPEHFETILTTKKGKYCTIDWQTIPRRNDQNGIIGYICLGNDTTDLKHVVSELDNYNKRLEEVMLSRISELTKLNEKLKFEIRGRILAEKRLGLNAVIVEKAPEVIFMIDGVGKIIFVNEAACHTYNCKHHELLNADFRHLIPENELPKVENILKSLREDRVSEVVTTHIRKDNSTFPARMRFVITDTPHGKFTICEVIDISRK